MVMEVNDTDVADYVVLECDVLKEGLSLRPT